MQNFKYWNIWAFFCCCCSRFAFKKKEPQLHPRFMIWMISFLCQLHIMRLHACICWNVCCVLGFRYFGWNDSVVHPEYGIYGWWSVSKNLSFVKLHSMEGKIYIMMVNHWPITFFFFFCLVLTFNIFFVFLRPPLNSSAMYTQREYFKCH